MPAPDKTTEAALPVPTPRLSWPVRVFVALFLFDLIFRGFSILLPWHDWIKEFGMQRKPRAFPTRSEYAKLRAEGEDKLAAEMRKSFASLQQYVNPWPTDEIRTRLASGEDWGKYSLAWLSSRLSLVENAAGFNQEWQMFSPSVGTNVHLGRARLCYEDGTERTVRQHTEPADLTRFFRWSDHIDLQFEKYANRDEDMDDECWGWCNVLSYRWPHNENGAPLQKILLYEIRIDYPPPGVDARAFLRDQMDKIRDHHSENASRTFYTFDVKTHEGVMEKRPTDQPQ